MNLLRKVKQRKNLIVILLLINGCQSLECSSQITIDVNETVIDSIEDVQIEFFQPGIKCKF